MTSPLFNRPLCGKIARSLGTAEGITRSELETLWYSFGPEGETPSGNKLDKANGIVGWITSRPNADAMFLELLNEVYYFDGKGDLRRNEDEFKPLLALSLARNSSSPTMRDSRCQLDLSLPAWNQRIVFRRPTPLRPPHSNHSRLESNEKNR